MGVNTVAVSLLVVGSPPIWRSSKLDHIPPVFGSKLNNKQTCFKLPPKSECFIVGTLIFTSWWFQPNWKILVKLDHFPKDRDEHKKYLKPPPIFSVAFSRYFSTFNLQHPSSVDGIASPPSWSLQSSVSAPGVTKNGGLWRMRRVNLFQKFQPLVGWAGFFGGKWDLPPTKKEPALTDSRFLAFDLSPTNLNQ